MNIPDDRLKSFWNHGRDCSDWSSNQSLNADHVSKDRLLVQVGVDVVVEPTVTARTSTLPIRFHSCSCRDAQNFGVQNFLFLSTIPSNLRRIKYHIHIT